MTAAPAFVSPARAAFSRGWVALGALAVLAAGAYAVALVTSDGDPLIALPLIGAVAAALIFLRPVLGLYLLFGGALLFEQWEISGLAPLTAQTHFFQNISAFTSLPVRLSPCDLLVLYTLACWAIRRRSGARIRFGPLAPGVAAAAAAFAGAGVVGFARAGTWDSIAALAELRGPLYMCIAYFLTANLVSGRRQLVGMCAAFVAVVGVKAVEAISNYQEMLGGKYPLEAVTSHEDVVFFDLAVVLCGLALFLRVRSRLVYALVAVLPVILLAELLTQRRVAFVALVAALAVTALLAYRASPRRTLVLSAIALAAFALYGAAFWGQGGALAEPIRAVRGLIDPASRSARDMLSDVWRDIEHANISYTVRQFPLTGVGLGQEYLFVQAPPALSDSFVYWRYMTHDALLWLWLKSGPLGAFAWWFLVAQTMFWCAGAFRILVQPALRLVVAVPVVLLAIQVVFSSVDLGLTYSRTMIMLGTALGLTAIVDVWARRLTRDLLIAGPRA